MRFRSRSLYPPSPDDLSVESLLCWLATLKSSALHPEEIIDLQSRGNVSDTWSAWGAVAVAKRGRRPWPPAPPNRQTTPITESLIERFLHRTAHAPDMIGIALTAGAHHAILEAHAKRASSTYSTRCHRPVDSRLDTCKHCSWDIRS